jgi:hypothetical protein
MAETECKLVLIINKRHGDQMFRLFFGSHIKKNDDYKPKEEHVNE